MTAPSPDGALVLAPQWLAHRYSHREDTVALIEVSREDRRRAPFLTDEALGGRARVAVRRADLMGVAPPPAPLHFVFHSAFCCSTLLANALDLVGTAATLKEPVILNDLIGWRHGGGPHAHFDAALRDTLRLLARPFEGGEAVVVKPSNLLNELAGTILAAMPSARAVFMAAPLAEFVASIATKGLEGRLWVRDLLARQVKGGLVGLGFTPDDLFRQTDLQVAATGWLVQHQLFTALSARLAGRILWLSSADLLAAPAERLRDVTRHFRLNFDETTTARIVATVFARNSKDGGRFSANDRASGRQRAMALHGEEITKVVAWAEAVAASAGLDIPGALMR